MALPTYSRYPEFPLVLERTANVVFADDGVGVVRSRLLTHQRPRTVALSWEAMTPADAAALVALFDACKGGAGKFLWQCPRDPAPVRWEFLGDSLPLERVSASCFRTSAPVRLLEAQNGDE